MQRGSDTGNTYSKCMKVDEKELVDMYNSRYHGAEFYSSSYIYLYLLHYMIPLAAVNLSRVLAR